MSKQKGIQKKDNTRKKQVVAVGSNDVILEEHGLEVLNMTREGVLKNG